MQYVSRTSSRQRQSMRNNTSDQTELKSVTKEAAGLERNIYSEINDYSQHSQDNSDPAYLTAVN
ncbi:hypothetical protein CHS0354_000346 [Potamilus streckersoni]|uniref:Uncharacterized protein n=1 Tax=Potamilus streckersoni TaxID=2493646 RepID=A0AAE0T683_9BIVA|nr:hypothetical protein CHS0354_000346 [Potamilus streckersoni]